LKKQSPALWNGSTGGSFERINTTDNKAVFAFAREKENSKVVVITNLTNKQKTLAILSKKANGNYKDVFTGQTVSLHQYQKLVLTPWQYMVLEK
jgi:glycosidase